MRSASAVAVAASLVLAVLVTALGVLGWKYSQAKASREVTAPPGDPSGAPARPRIDQTNLATSALADWEPLDAPGMIGRYESFDPVANLEWARSIAKAWKLDASLYRIDLVRVAKNGRVDVTAAEGEVDYRFQSPQCVASSRTSSEHVEHGTRCDLHLRVKSHDGAPGLAVMTPEGTPVGFTLEDPVCSLSQALAAMESMDAPLTRPFYKAALDAQGLFVDGQRYPAWTFGTESIGEGNLPAVDSKTCALDDYWLKHKRPNRAGLTETPAEIVWNGHIVSSAGKVPRAGAPCTLTTRVTPWVGDVAEEQTTLVCEGRTLHDSRAYTAGSFGGDFALKEVPVAGEVNAFHYQLVTQDLGERYAPSSQLVVDTRKGLVEAFIERGAEWWPFAAAPSPADPRWFKVHVAVDAYSVVRHGKPLLPQDLPPFDAVVVRSARVTAKDGTPPFVADSCVLRISPANATVTTCRAQLVCDGRVVFGEGDSGFEACVVADGKPQRFTDPAFTCDLQAATATLHDAPKKGAAYSVSFALEAAP